MGFNAATWNTALARSGTDATTFAKRPSTWLIGWHPSWRRSRGWPTTTAGRGFRTGQDLFAAVDPSRFELCLQNPVRLLQEASATRAAPGGRAGRSAARTRHATRGGGPADMTRPPDDRPVDDRRRPVAFLCAEYGVHVSLPVYSGGLGALAGDLLKEASDRACRSSPSA